MALRKRYSFSPLASNYPSVYKIKLTEPSEIEKLFSDLIFADAPQSKLIDCLTAYVNTYIEPCGWRAIWRTFLEKSSDLVCDFTVEVVDVTLGALEASVEMKDILYPKLDGPELIGKQNERDCIKKLLAEKSIKVPLSELYVINDTVDGEEFSVTAQVIEHVRFCFRHLIRPWDEIVQPSRPDLPFAEAILPHRIRLHFDITNGQVSKTVVDRVNYLIEEGQKLKEKWEVLEKKVKQAVDSGDNEANEDNLVDDVDLYEYLKLKMKLEDFDTEMRRLEDPIMRLVMLMEYQKNEPSEKNC